MESIISILFHPAMIGAICFAGLHWLFTHETKNYKEPKKSREFNHGQLMTVLIVIMFCLLIIIGKL